MATGADDGADRRSGPGRRIDDYEAGVLAGGLAARLAHVEAAATEARLTARRVDVIEAEFKGMRADQAEMQGEIRGEMRGLRRSQSQLMLSITSAAVVFALGVLALIFH
jgi:hypothetical protein